MPRFVLFSTTDVSSGRSSHLQRMIHSVAAARDADPTLDIYLLLLLQKCPADYDPSGLPDWVSTQSIEKQISLSAARNRLLRTAIDGNLVPADSIYAFPDDDCWYPDNILSEVANTFADNEGLEFWFCRYSSTPESRAVAACEVPDLQQVISRASSNTFFFRGRLISEIGNFDETLGVGAALNGGEDTEYAIRAYYAARRTLYTDAALIGHRDADPGLRPKYFPGTLRAIARHRHRSMQGLKAYARKLLVGAALVAQGKMKASAYLSAIRAA